MKTLLIGVLLAALAVLSLYSLAQRRTISELIELNHSKSLYLDSHCSGYTGTEEFLPNELPGDSK